MEGRSSVIETFKQLLAEEGTWGLTKGLSARIISSLPTSVLIVVGYETLKRLSLRADLVESRHWWKATGSQKSLVSGFISDNNPDLSLLCRCCHKPSDWVVLMWGWGWWWWCNRVKVVTFVIRDTWDFTGIANFRLSASSGCFYFFASLLLWNVKQWEHLITFFQNQMQTLKILPLKNYGFFICCCYKISCFFNSTVGKWRPFVSHCSYNVQYILTTQNDCQWF